MKLTFPKISMELFPWAEMNRIRILIIVFSLTLVVTLFQYNVFKRFEYVTYDYRCQMRWAQPTRPNIAVVEISDDSIAKIGRWPWGREWHATLIRILSDLGARAIVFDVIFSEPSDPQKDELLAEAMRSSKRVYLAQVVEERPGDRARSLLTSMPQFLDASRGGGHINLRPDVDGVMRRIPLTINVNGRPVPQLSLKVALDQWGSSMKEVFFRKNSALISTVTGYVQVPLDDHGNMILDWMGRWHETFKHYSYIDVIASYAKVKAGKKPVVNLEDFRGKIVYVGTSASGLFDIRPTPLEPLYPAVGVNLMVLDNLLQTKFVREVGFAENVFIMILLTIAMYFISKSKSYVSSALFTILLAVLYLAFAMAVFNYFGWWVNVVYPILLIFGTYYFVTLYNQLAIAIERTKLLKMATRDALTGLYNIGQFKLLLKAELATLAIRNNDRAMSILMSDADNFKKTNDTYGHVAGDQVLRELAAVIKQSCRALDVAARYGGEEFIVMLPGANEQEAAKVADKIRVGLSQKVFKHEKGDFQTTISMGVTQARPGEKDIEALVMRADKALYEAKHTGKNKVVIFTDSMASPK